MMKVYGMTFSGIYPVGASAVVVAENEEEAKMLLKQTVADTGHGWDVGEIEVKKVLQRPGTVVILTDGNY